MTKTRELRKDDVLANMLGDLMTHETIAVTPFQLKCIKRHILSITKKIPPHDRPPRIIEKIKKANTGWDFKMLIENHRQFMNLLILTHKRREVIQ